VPAFAQFQPPRPRSERPQRGLFGSGYGNTEQSLILSASFGGGYDNDLLGQATGAPTPSGGPRGVGRFGFGAASLGYSINREPISASAHIGGTGHYYPEMDNPRVFALGAGMQASWQIARRSSLSTSNQLNSQPYSLRAFYGLPVDAETSPDSTDVLNYAIGSVSYMDWRSSVDFSQGITEHLTASVGYTYFNVDYGDEDNNYASHSILGRLTYQVTKSLSVHGGYGRTTTDYGSDELDGRYGARTIDAGVDFGKAVSLTRRTSMTFAAGVSGIENYGDVNYYFTGNVNVTHELGRSWTVFAEARRAANFYQTFGDPVVSTSVTGGISGLLHRRVQVGAQGGWSRGIVGIASIVPEFDSWTAGASMRYAIARSAGLSVTYSIFHYVFDENGAPQPIGTEPEMRNQSVRVTFDWSTPLMTVARRANASR